MMTCASSFAVFLLLVSTPTSSCSHQKEAAMGSTGVFVQLFEWSWKDVAKECEQWLGPKGFKAVQVSPPNEHVSGDAWHTRYQPVSYKLHSRSGTEAEFVSMVQRCRESGVGVYVDAVFNHMAGPWGGVGVAGSIYGNRTYPDYQPEHFHHSPSDESKNCGISNWNDAYNVQYCDLEGLPDLCTACPHVRDTVVGYVNRMAKIGISGIRVDAAKNMNQTELGDLLDGVNESLYRFQEVPFGGVVTQAQYLPNGPVTEFGYSGSLSPKFADSGKLQNDLSNFGPDWGLVPGDKSVVFLDNHDTQRGMNGMADLTYKSGPIYFLANVFMLAYPYGYPRVMSSYFFVDKDQGPPSEAVHGPDGSVRCGPGTPWVCEHRHPNVANMVAWRKTAGDAPLSPMFTNGNQLAFCRGGRACIALNRSPERWRVQTPIDLPAGVYCDVSRDDSRQCPSVHVGAGGKVDLTVEPFSALALHTGAMKPSASLRGHN